MEIRDNIYTRPDVAKVKQAVAKDTIKISSKTDVKAEDVKAKVDLVDISGNFPVKEKTSKESPRASTIVRPEEKKLMEQAPLFRKDLYSVGDGGKKVEKVTFIYDPGGRECLENLKLIGSWDKCSGKYSTEWKSSAVPMEKMEDGRYKATITVLDDAPHDWQWGVLADGPSGKGKWAVFEEGNLKFDPSVKDKTFLYSPTTSHKMGAYREKEDINFRYWAPHARDLSVKVWDDDPVKAQYIPMEKDAKTGTWSAKIDNGWKDMVGKNYVYDMVTSEGKRIERTDPYAREVQGIQKGINTIYLHPKTGKQVHQFHYEDGKKTFMRFTRFEIQGHGNAEAAYLKLFDKEGKPMTREALQERLGKIDGSLVEKFHEGEFNDFYENNIDEQGRIKLTKQGDAWASMINGAQGLTGLDYQLEVYNRDESGNLQMVGDVNKDGILQPVERKATPFNDPYTNEIQKEIGFERAGIITDLKAFEWKNDDVPRMTTDKSKYVIYQAHVGSIFGEAGNVRRSTFKDMIKKLEYFKDIGVNTIELLPTNAAEGTRDWGYIGTNSFAQTSNYGFVDDNGKWVNGTEALKRFVDAAHGKGFNVINDVVYNHFGGEFNQSWESDGSNNPWFNWDQPTENVGAAGLFKSSGSKSDVHLRGVMKDAQPKSDEKTKVESGKNSLFKGLRDTPWGAMPAYDQPQVSGFLVNNAMMQLDELNFDGLRFDFTNPIHDQSSGATPGWNMLRKMNREIHFFHPDAITSAEEFPNSPLITKPALSDGKGGAGFDNMWNTEFQHRLVHSHHQWGILQEAAQGAKTNMDKFMGHMIEHPGFESQMNSVTVISNHDEVGNADRIINVAQGGKQADAPEQWARNASRFAFGVGMLSPGIPIFFQGSESLANNRFSWAITSSWDIGWDWQDVGKDANWKNVTFNDGQITQYDRLLSMSPEQRENDRFYKDLSIDNKKIFEYLTSQDPENIDKAKYNVMRKMHSNFSRDVISLRKNSPAFDGDAEINRVYTHNENSVMAFHRKKNNEEFLVFSSLNKNDMGNYNIPLLDGKWKLTFNSDNTEYGGKGFGNGKEYVEGNAGSRFDLPAGGMLVYKRIG
ncbi:MAG: alpha amylase C-terminal domain-containing protein [Candidatus Eremiobacteraeota bacterium]|nr:alpha amylase C-terminal domain-containing protein [Candidatus Eremiobacteraeota bacterium]